MDPQERLRQQIQAARKRVDDRWIGQVATTAEPNQSPTNHLSSYAIDNLIITVLDDSNASRRKQAIDSLVKSQDPKVGGFLTKALLREKEPSVRTALVWAIGELKYEKARSFITELSMHDPAVEVRAAALSVAGELGG